MSNRSAAVEAFLASEQVVYEPGAAVPWQEFKAAVLEFCDAHRILHFVGFTHPDVYETAFAARNITRQVVSRSWRGFPYAATEFVVGADVAPGIGRPANPLDAFVGSGSVVKDPGATLPLSEFKAAAKTFLTDAGAPVPRFSETVLAVPLAQYGATLKKTTLPDTWRGYVYPAGTRVVGLDLALSAGRPPNPMESFLASEGLQYDPAATMPLSHFKKAYQNFVLENNVVHHKFSDDLLHAPFASRGIRVTSTSFIWRERAYMGQCVVGVDLASPCIPSGDPAPVQTLERFLSSEKVVCAPDAAMPLDAFKKAFRYYCDYNYLPKPRFDRRLFTNEFRTFNLRVQACPSRTWRGKTYEAIYFVLGVDLIPV